MQVKGKDHTNAWDKISDYKAFCAGWLRECQRVLKPNGVMYVWQGDIVQTYELLTTVYQSTDFKFKSFCVWDKGRAYRARVWLNRVPGGRSALRKWFTISEYCLHFTLERDKTAPRYTHHCDVEHCNIWHVPPVPSNGRLHTCQKPLEILQRLIRVSSNPGDTVLDCFMGSGSTGVACVREGREFIGIERERVYFDRAAEWIRAEAGKTEVIYDYGDAAREASQADSDGA